MGNFRVNAKTEKTTLSDNDVFLLEDSADSFNTKKMLSSTISDYVISSTTQPGIIQTSVSSSISSHLLCDGSTIGDIGSGADYESADYETLFNILKNISDYGNAGTEVFADGDTVYLPNRVYQSIVMSLSANQTTGIASADPIQFDTTQFSKNMSLNSYGAILSPFKTYLISFGVRVNTSGDLATSFRLRAAGNAVQTLISNTYSIDAAANSSAQPSITTLYTPTAQETLTCNVYVVGDLSAIVGGATTSTYMKIETVGCSLENTFIRYK